MMLYDQIPPVIDGSSPVLGPYSFLNRQGIFKFKQGTEYTIKEALILSRGRSRDLKAVDTVKRIFSGEVIGYAPSDYTLPPQYRRGKKCR